MKKLSHLLSFLMMVHGGMVRKEIPLSISSKTVNDQTNKSLGKEECEITTTGVKPYCNTDVIHFTRGSAKLIF